ncbi:protein O-mannosyl-transferase family [Gemmatimonas sp.]|uniref:protein O-mannosyl-transferase family n=1 Tax=Gemmatimonas sp. TaxID=1962908 RepID=UPI00391FC59F
MNAPARIQLPSAIVAAVVATMVLLGLYLSTAAPDLTFWDATEFMAAAHTLGIPHPPGTPLWVVLGNVATRLFASAAPPRAVTLLSVWAAALTGGLTAWMMARALGARGAVVGAVMAGTMFSVWNNATETEVYAVTMLASVAMLAAGEFAGRHDSSDGQRARGRALVAFLAGLAVPLHLSLLVALPAAIVLAWRGARPTRREMASWLALCLLGLSAVSLLPLLSVRNPALDSGNPEHWQALLAVLRREQYQVAGLWPRQAPLWLQVANVFQWADWQVAFAAHPFPTAAFGRTALSLCWVWLAALGLRRVWHVDARLGRGLAVLLASATLGVAVWLNLRAGPTFGVGVLPDGAPHEARERDYFFVLAFWAWGVLAAAGVAALAAGLARRLPAPVALLPFALVLVPVLGNRPVADRTREPVASLPRTYARLLLDAVPPGGVLVTGGDNDSFPLWYLQQVEEYRTDVAVVTVPLLGASWYRAQLAAQRLLDGRAVTPWPGSSASLRGVMQSARMARRPVRVSTLLEASDRRRLDPASGWALQGLVYAPDSTVPGGRTALDLRALRASRDLLPVGALDPLPVHADPAAHTAQELLRCTQLTTRTDTLLVSGCNGV